MEEKKNVNFKFTSFCTKYTSESSNSRLRTDQEQGTACFNKIFNPDLKGIQKVKYKIFLNTDSSMVSNKNKNNLLFLSKNQIKRHMNALYTFIPKNTMKYTLSYKEGKGVILELKVRGGMILHKLILTWSRYLYEYPYNVGLLDVDRLREAYGFKKMSYLRLLNIVLLCVGRLQSCVEHCHINTTLRFPKNIRTSNYKKYLSDTSAYTDRLNVFWGDVALGCWCMRNDGDRSDFLDEIEIKEPENDLTYKSEYWLSPEYFDARLTKYKICSKMINKYGK